MEKNQKPPNGRSYDLEESTFLFATETRELMNIFGAILRKSE
ncbi:MAG TPA: hypothetical protein VH207_04550 [Chthoniobacterales bacterium]|jgi:hypothetical protein|nr:hypothetical protein [Chthoniobacterales bacterium]